MMEYPPEDCYQILGVDRESSQDVIRETYKKLAKIYHPDRFINGSPRDRAAAEEKFKKIAEAYGILSDGARRRAYDQWKDRKAEPPRPVVVPKALDFGIVPSDESRTLQLTVENKGGPVGEVNLSLEDDTKPFSVDVSASNGFPITVDVTFRASVTETSSVFVSTLTISLDHVRTDVRLEAILKADPVPPPPCPGRDSHRSAPPKPTSTPSASPTSPSRASRVKSKRGQVIAIGLAISTLIILVGAMSFLLFNRQQQNTAMEASNSAGAWPIDSVTLAPTAYIQGISARVQSLQFFKGGDSAAPKEQRQYSTTFRPMPDDSLYWELNLEHPKRSARQDFTIFVYLYDPSGALKTQYQSSSFVEPQWDNSFHFGKWSMPAANWVPGEYRVSFFVDGVKVAASVFTILDPATDTRTLEQTSVDKPTETVADRVPDSIVTNTSSNQPASDVEAICAREQALAEAGIGDLMELDEYNRIKGSCAQIGKVALLRERPTAHINEPIAPPKVSLAPTKQENPTSILSDTIFIQGDGRVGGGVYDDQRLWVEAKFDRSNLANDMLQVCHSQIPTMRVEWNGIPIGSVTLAQTSSGYFALLKSPTVNSFVPNNCRLSPPANVSVYLCGTEVKKERILCTHHLLLK